MRSPAMVSVSSFIVLLVSLVLVAPIVWADWIDNGTPVIAVVADQENAQALPDGNGGAFIVWEDTWSGNRDIYAQHIDAQGNPLWNADGMPVCTAPDDQFLGGLVSDGAGGIIVAWDDARLGLSDANIYAQRLNASGIGQWTFGGRAVCTASGVQAGAKIVSDLAGGAIVAWEDLRSDPLGDVYAARVTSAGTLPWDVDGNEVCTHVSQQSRIDACTDGSGGIFVTWYDFRYGDADIFVNRLEYDGKLAGAINGRDVTSIIGTGELYPKIVQDGYGGAVIVWQDFRNDDGDIYAMRVNASAVNAWSSHVAVAIENDRQYEFRIIREDSAGDFIVMWQDRRDEPSSGIDIYTQKFDLTGKMKWGANGIPVCKSASSQFVGHLASDGAGGAILAWEDFRYTPIGRLYASRVTEAGVKLWADNGVVVTDAEEYKRDPFVVSDGLGGAMVVWDEYKTGDIDLYVQRLEPKFGYWGHPEPTISAVADIAGDQGGFVRVSWLPGDQDTPVYQDTQYYSVWRATDAVVKLAPESLVELAAIEPGFEGPAYRAAAGDFYWEYLGEQLAHGFAGYSFAAATEADSSAAGNALHQFQVVAHSFASFVAFPSTELSGYSVDNLAPASPNQLVALRLGGSTVGLDWRSSGEDEEDFAEYVVYRSETMDVPIEDPYFLGATPDSMLTDTGADPGREYYYVVLARDLHGNLSVPSNEAKVTAATTVDEPVARVTRLLGAYPNPFNPSTSIRFELAREQRLTVEVFDVAGRKVRSLVRDDSWPAGSHELRWDGRDGGGSSVASGSYLYRFVSEDLVETRRVTLIK